MCTTLRVLRTEVPYRAPTVIGQIPGVLHDGCNRLLLLDHARRTALHSLATTWRLDGDVAPIRATLRRLSAQAKAERARVWRAAREIEGQDNRRMADKRRDWLGASTNRKAREGARFARRLVWRQDPSFFDGKAFR